MSSKEVTGRSTVTGAITKRTAKRVNVRYMTMTAMLSAVAFVLMLLEFPVPIMPWFIQLDFSELPALIGAYAMGPISGVIICLLKNLLHLIFMSGTGGVGELSNFILGSIFVIPAGLLYKKKKSKKNALIGAVVGAVCMAGFSALSNNYLVYPIYYNFMPKDTIIEAYRTAGKVLHLDITWKTMMPYLLAFNVPFTFVKGMLDVLFTFLIYKPISAFIKGTGSQN